MSSKFPFPGYIKSLHRYQILSQFILDQPVGAKVLDLGCGPCDFAGYIASLGYVVTGVDDLSDQWHLSGNNRERIRDYAENMKVKLITTDVVDALPENYYDAVYINDVIEHLHNSPREMLNSTINALRQGGKLIISTPNSSALFKRLKLLGGKPSGTSSEFFYWNIGQFRSHVRELAPHELSSYLEHHNLQNIEVHCENCWVQDVPGISARFYSAVSNLWPTWRDTIIVTGIKPSSWLPTPPSMHMFRSLYAHLDKWNLDGDSDEVMLKKIESSHK